MHAGQYRPLLALGVLRLNNRDEVVGAWVVLLGRSVKYIAGEVRCSGAVLNLNLLILLHFKKSIIIFLNTFIFSDFMLIVPCFRQISDPLDWLVSTLLLNTTEPHPESRPSEHRHLQPLELQQLWGNLPGSLKRLGVSPIALTLLTGLNERQR